VRVMIATGRSSLSRAPDPGGARTRDPGRRVQRRGPLLPPRSSDARGARAVEPDARARSRARPRARLADGPDDVGPEALPPSPRRARGAGARLDARSRFRRARTSSGRNASSA
jgi:hypothetical protein